MTPEERITNLEARLASAEARISALEADRAKIPSVPQYPCAPLGPYWDGPIVTCEATADELESSDAVTGAGDL